MTSKYEVISNFQYVVINTGYTSRLWNEADSDGNATINTDHGFIENLSEQLYDKYMHRDYSEEKANSMIEPLFAYDDLWGTGLYKIKNNKEADNIINILKEVDKFNYGIICFKCKVEDLHILQDVMSGQYSYCRAFEVTDIEMLANQNENDPNIIIITYDSESG